MQKSVLQICKLSLTHSEYTFHHTNKNELIIKILLLPYSYLMINIYKQRIEMVKERFQIITFFNRLDTAWLS